MSACRARCTRRSCAARTATPASPVSTCARRRRCPAWRGSLLPPTCPTAGPPIPMRMFRHPGMERFLQRPLAREVARYSGEPVAVVVADSRYRAEDAAELVGVDYEPVPAVVDAARALEPDAPVLHEHAGTNLAAEYRIGHGDADASFADADVVVAARIGCQRHAAVPLETRGLLVEPRGKDGRPTIWGASKIPHVNRRMLAAMLGRDETDIRFVELSVGGGFGARGEFYPEDYLIPWCALALDRPIAWAEDREEHLRSTNHSREQAHDLELALAADGTFLAMRGTLLNNTGAYVRTHGSVVPGMTAGMLPGPYRLPAYQVVVRQVVTNKTPSGTYRAPGRYEATLARERLVDMAARELNRDPADLRGQNLVAPDEMPYAVGTELEGHPVVYDSGDYPRLLQAGLERFDCMTIGASPPRLEDRRLLRAAGRFVDDVDGSQDLVQDHPGRRPAHDRRNGIGHRHRDADFVSLARPLIREPDLVRKIERAWRGQAECVSCNICLMHEGAHGLKCWRKCNRDLA